MKAERLSTTLHSRKHSPTRRATTGASVAILCSVLLSACMISPYDGQVIGTRDTPITFNNCTNYPNGLIQIERCTNWFWQTPAGKFLYWPAGEPVCTSSKVLTTFRTSTVSAATDAWGMNWYCGSGSAKIPRTEWSITQGNVHPFFALVRAKEPESNPFGTGTVYQSVYHNPPQNPDGTLACPASFGAPQLNTSDRRCPNGSVAVILAD